MACEEVTHWVRDRKLHTFILQAANATQLELYATNIYDQLKAFKYGRCDAKPASHEIDQITPYDLKDYKKKPFGVMTDLESYTPHSNHYGIKRTVFLKNGLPDTVCLSTFETWIPQLPGLKSFYDDAEMLNYDDIFAAHASAKQWGVEASGSNVII